MGIQKISLENVLINLMVPLCSCFLEIQTDVFNEFYVQCKKFTQHICVIALTQETGICLLQRQSF